MKYNFRMTKPIIRFAKPGEESAIHEAHMRSIREVCCKDHSAEEILVWGNRPLGNRWVEAIKIGHVWVVELNNQIYGHAYIRFFEENSEKRAHIHGLYLTPEVIGQGLGLKLGKLMIDTAKSKGVKTITLESTLTAHGFYKSLGFSDSGPLSTLEMSGQPIRYFPMSLQL
jgi:N-acetylglutamate synthase-like GNAT family acetyltransferase